MSESQHTVHVRVLAELNGAETYELGAATLTRDDYPRELAALLRAAAEHLETEADP